jgi:hypothetical protein
MNLKKKTSLQIYLHTSYLDNYLRKNSTATQQGRLYSLKISLSVV